VKESYDWTYSTPYILCGKTMIISRQDYDELPEYSATAPTGVYYGKMWRRHNGAFDREFLARGGKPTWFVCQYLPHPTKGDLCVTKMYKPFFVRKVKLPTHCGGKMLLECGTDRVNRRAKVTAQFALYRDPQVRDMTARG
jgi:hypothetical protein